jgi:hypothetical protein
MQGNGELAMYLKNIPQGSKNEPVSYLYQQAISWELMRLEYFTHRNDLRMAEDAAERAKHYTQRYNELPETGHLFNRDYS